jgi:hypothetical protein
MTANAHTDSARMISVMCMEPAEVVIPVNQTPWLVMQFGWA